MKKYALSKILAIIAVITIAVFACTAYFADYKNAKKYYEMGGDNPALFLAIAKAESGFSETAISSKGAVGLCQIMPKTAEWCALQMNVTIDENLLLIGEVNAEISNFYMNYLLEKFGSQEVAICAYNAGEGNVSNWLKNPEIYNGETFINIPFEETKNYLKKVQAYQKKFQTYITLFGWE